MNKFPTDKCRHRFLFSELMFALEQCRDEINELPIPAGTYFDNGSEAIVFDLGNGTVARVSSYYPSDLPEHRLINQRVTHWRVGDEKIGVTIEIFPKLNVWKKGMKKDEWIAQARKLEVDLWNDGIEAVDVDYANVGHDDEGTWKIIDPGCF